MNLKEKIQDIIYEVLTPESEDFQANLNYSETYKVAGKIEELVKELAAEFAITYLVPSHYTVEETKEVFETFLAEK